MLKQINQTFTLHRLQTDDGRVIAPLNQRMLIEINARSMRLTNPSIVHEVALLEPPGRGLNES